jgi:DNA processing protein
VSGQVACAAAIASLPAMTPQRLRRLAAACPLGGDAGDPITDWVSLWRELRIGGRLVRAAAAPGLARRWALAARTLDVAEVVAQHEQAGVTVLPIGDRRYPAHLATDPEAPAVVFSRGRLEQLDLPAVAVIGTRSATHYGTDVAAELGLGLAQAGVVVVSGLAPGIDAAAHEGALSDLARGVRPGAGGRGDGAPSESAPPVAVAGAGLDVDYPRATMSLRRRIEETGGVIAEAPLGAPAEPWRFPLRNRIIASLVSVVVVVESHRAGGSLHTVDAALARGVEVFAVPGSIRSRASAGTNALLSAGAQVATCVEDVLAAVALRTPVAITPRPPRRAVERGAVASKARVDTAPEALSELQRRVLVAVEVTPTPTQEILSRVGEGLGPVALALDQLLELGRVRDCGGAWERCGPAPGVCR